MGCKGNNLQPGGFIGSVNPLKSFPTFSRRHRALEQQIMRKPVCLIQ